MYIIVIKFYISITTRFIESRNDKMRRENYYFEKCKSIIFKIISLILKGNVKNSKWKCYGYTYRFNIAKSCCALNKNCKFYD